MIKVLKCFAPLYMAFILLLSVNSFAQQPSLYLNMVAEEEGQHQPGDHAFLQAAKKLDQYKEVTVKTDLKLPPFHQRKTAVKSQSHNLCLNCHNVMPHQKLVRSRTFLNAHSKTISCQTCHFRPEDKPLNYQWMDTAGKLSQQIDLEQKEKFKLVAVYQGRAVFDNKNSPLAKQINEAWQQSSAEQKPALWLNLHTPLTTDKTGCSTCHQQKQPLFDLMVLGADREQASDFENNVIARFFTRYKDTNDKINIIELLE